MTEAEAINLLHHVATWDAIEKRTAAEDQERTRELYVALAEQVQRRRECEGCRIGQWYSHSCHLPTQVER